MSNCEVGLCLRAVFPCMWEWSICTEQHTTPRERHQHQQNTHWTAPPLHYTHTHTHGMRRSGLEINRLSSFSGTLYHPWKRDSGVCVALTEQLHSVWLQHGLILVNVKGIFLLSFTPPHVIHLFWETQCILRNVKKKLSKHWKSTATTTVWISAFFKISSFCYTEESFIGLNDSRGIDDDRSIIFGWKIDLIWVCLYIIKSHLLKY